MSMSRSNLFRFLDTVGDGTGAKNAIGNYSVAAEQFKIIAPANTRYAIRDTPDARANRGQCDVYR